MTDPKRSTIFFCLAILLLAGLSCSLGGGAAQPDATLVALGESVQRTATAAAQDKDTTGNDLATAEAEATQRSQSIQATQTASSANRDVSQLGTATVAAPVIAELPFYEVDTQQGRLGWMHEPVTVTIDGYHQYGFANDYPQVTARDFVLAADITWNTQYGTSGCGFMFRSDGEKNKPSQYMVIATRLGNGHVIFTALAKGEMANVQDFYANTLDASFQAQNGTTNRMAIVGRGNIIEIYTNGVKLGQVDTTQPPPDPVLPTMPRPPADKTNMDEMKKYQDRLKEYTEMVDQVQTNYALALKNNKTTDAVFEDGFLGMVALSESGQTVCKFDEAWLWLIE